jgi:hypothetical protein
MIVDVLPKQELKDMFCPIPKDVRPKDCSKCSYLPYC